MQTTQPSALVSSTAPPVRVLLVEDNESDAMIAQAAVEKAARGPSNILRATSLANALVTLRSTDVDFVLLDLNLPDSRGVNTLKRVRVATRCPIVVITVEDRPGLDEEALGNGAFEILHKGRLGPDTFVRLLRLAEDRSRVQGSLEHAEHRFRSLVELSSDWYWEQDNELRFTFFSPGYWPRSGATAEKLFGKRRWEEPGRAPLRGTWEEHLATLAARKPFRDLEFVRVSQDGTRSFQSVNGEPFYDAAGNFAGYHGTGRDITERKLAQEALERTRARLELALAASRVCTWDYDHPSGVVVLSESWAEMIGGPPGETRTTAKARSDLVHPDDLASVERLLIDAVKGLSAEYAVEHRVRHRSGEWRWIVSRGKVVERDARGRAVRMVGTNLDITERKCAEERLAHLAQFDAVTGLPNRGLLGERLEQAIAQARRHGRGAGVLFINLDNFKLINDTLGKPAGDELLAQAGKRLRDCVRPDDTVGRLGGDEFAVAVADLARADDAAMVARKILDAFAAPFDLLGHEAFVTASIGIAAFPNDGDGADALLKCADTAMDRVKESSRNAFCFFAADMNARAAPKLQLHTDLRHAVDRREFVLHYQPKVELASGAMIGMEALLRWQHPVRGMISPAEFIPALEDTGLIVPVGDWVVEEARTQLRKWIGDRLQAVPIAVNLSAKQFRRRDLGKVICRLLAEQGIPPELLELEITESCLMDDPRDAVRQLQALREAGLKISVDDFGTGYSSLAYLTRLPLSTLKIDRSFVSAAISDPGSAAIVRMVIDMAQNLRFNVVAEGIESEKQVAFLRQNHCEQGQGYYFGKPMPAASIADRLQRRA